MSEENARIDSLTPRISRFNRLLGGSLVSAAEPPIFVYVKGASVSASLTRTQAGAKKTSALNERCGAWVLNLNTYGTAVCFLESMQGRVRARQNRGKASGII